MATSARMDHGYKLSHPRSHPPRGVARDSLSDFMTRNSLGGEWKPGVMEPTIAGGSPPPRRRQNRARRSPLGEHRVPPRNDAVPSPMATEVSVPENPVITLTDYQLRKAFGPSPMFGGADLLNDRVDPLPGPNPPTPKRKGSDDEGEVELEAMKQLSMEEMLTVFKGLPMSEGASEGPRAPPASPMHLFDDSPWTRPAVTLAAKEVNWPPLA
jgi:hypothetical protein